MLRPAHRIDTGQAGRIRSARVGPTLVPAEASRTRMRRPPLVVVFVALLVIALGETAGAVISQLRPQIVRYAQARVAANPRPHGLAGSPEYDVEITARARSEEHTSELQSLTKLVCRLVLEKKNRPTSSRSEKPLSILVNITTTQTDKPTSTGKRHP